METHYANNPISVHLSALEGTLRRETFFSASNRAGVSDYRGTSDEKGVCCGANSLKYLGLRWVEVFSLKITLEA